MCEKVGKCLFIFVSINVYISNAAMQSSITFWDKKVQIFWLFLCWRDQIHGAGKGDKTIGEENMQTGLVTKSYI
jgi:hypothetical protein